MKTLKNQVFERKSGEAMRRQLSIALKKKSCGALDDRVIGLILQRVVLHRQYKISVFSNYTTFCNAVISVRDQKAPMAFVASEIKRGFVTAAITPLSMAEPKKNHRVIYIYVQSFTSGKERKNG
ncbi:MAG: hypothetical protein FWC62_06525 [Firmicutes bacterium]|nr:hypothetical protein [Bacillota bacterium]